MLGPCLGTTTLFDDHVRNGTVDNAIAQIEIQQLYGAHLLRRAARYCRGAELHHMRVFIFGQKTEHTLAGTVGCFVAFRGDNPIPAKLFKIHCQRIPAAAGFVVVFITVQRKIAFDAFLRCVAKFDLDVGCLTW